jgi:hypothetical protein
LIKGRWPCWFTRVHPPSHVGAAGSLVPTHPHMLAKVSRTNRMVAPPCEPPVRYCGTLTPPHLNTISIRSFACTLLRAPLNRGHLFALVPSSTFPRLAYSHIISYTPAAATLPIYVGTFSMAHHLHVVSRSVPAWTGHVKFSFQRWMLITFSWVDVDLLFADVGGRWWMLVV